MRKLHYKGQCTKRKLSKCKENLGAVKVMLYSDGTLGLYIYGDKGHAEPIYLEERIDAAPEELLALAAMLTENADGKSLWDEDIQNLDTKGVPEEDAIDRFLSLKRDHEPMIELIRPSKRWK